VLQDVAVLDVGRAAAQAVAERGQFVGAGVDLVQLHEQVEPDAVVVRLPRGARRDAFDDIDHDEHQRAFAGLGERPEPRGPRLPDPGGGPRAHVGRAQRQAALRERAPHGVQYRGPGSGEFVHIPMLGGATTVNCWKVTKSVVCHAKVLHRSPAEGT
jgi:hypothetical protein